MERKKRQFLKHLKDGQGIITYACSKSKISRQTYYNWLKADAEFAEECDAVNESVVDIVESKLLSKINDNDTTAIIFFLKSKGKNRGYVERVENDIRANPFIDLMKSLPDDDIDAE